MSTTTTKTTTTTSTTTITNTVTYRNGTNETTAAEGERLFLSRVPFYGTIIIATAGCALLICCLWWMILHLCNKKANGSNGAAVKTKGVKASLLHEMVQPEMDELDGAESNFVGRLHFSVDYSRADEKLTVTVIEAQDLAAMDFGGSSDPYVKVRVLPNKKQFFRTKVVDKNCNPMFNETFTFEIPLMQLDERALQLLVLDHDAIGSDDPIGSVTIPLSELDLSRVMDEWRELVKDGLDSGDMAIKPGDICVSLRYVPAANLLTVVIIEAKNLPMTEDGGDPDSFVKLTLSRRGKRIKRKRSTIRKSCKNPYFNETFTFEVAFSDVATVKLEVALCAPHFIKSKRLGFIEIGLDVTGVPQAIHWKDMLSNQRHSIARWHKLQPVETHD